MILIVSSLPLMILCYLLGGLLLSEITRSYLVLILAAGTFGLLSSPARAISAAPARPWSSATW